MRTTHRPATRGRGRLVAGLMAATVTLVLTACAEGETGGDAAPAEPAETEAAADDPAAFFDGETITFIVPYNPGGGFDTFVRLLAPKLEEQIPGVSVTVENQPGGGGLIGANAVFEAEPDGLTVGLINYPGAVFAQATEQEGVALDNAEWTLLTRLGAIPPLVYTGAESGYETFEDVLGATEPVVFGIGGVGSDAYYATVVMSKALGFPNEIVAGYPGSGEADGALVVGEVDASVNSIDAALATVEGSGANPVVFISTEPSEKLPDVPLITEFGDADQQEVLTALASYYDLERLVVAPPGVDEARADFLADAIYQAASGGDYEEEMDEAGYTVNPMEREEVVELAAQANESLELLTPLVKE